MWDKQHIHEWLIKKVVGRRPVIMNVKFIGDVEFAAGNRGTFMYNCTIIHPPAAYYVDGKYGDNVDESK